jgi:hypothetical protein
MIPHENRNRTPHTSNVWSRSGNPPSAPPITFYRKAILRRCARYCSTRICLKVVIARDDAGVIHGFLGVDENRIEMLFVDDASRERVSGNCC